MSKNNLQAKLKREITEIDSKKIDNFLRESVSLIQMSNLLNYYADPDNKISDLVIDKKTIKDIQLSYFMEYADKNLVDEICIRLFVNCADIEPTTRKFSFNKSASKKMRELVDIDSQGYISKFIKMDELYIYSPCWWKPIFEENTDEMEKYLFEKKKDYLTGINDARTLWKLYKCNGYKEIQINGSIHHKGMRNDEIFHWYGVLLDEMLEIEKDLEQIKNDISVNNSESESNKRNRLLDLKEKLNSIHLYITLNGDLSREIDQELSNLPTEIYE